MAPQSLSGRLRILAGHLRACAQLAQAQGFPSTSSELWRLAGELDELDVDASSDDGQT